MTREHSNPDLHITACAACHAITDGEALCRDLAACQGRIRERVRQKDAAWHTRNARPLAAWSEGRDIGGEGGH